MGELSGLDFKKSSETEKSLTPNSPGTSEILVAHGLADGDHHVFLNALYASDEFLYTLPTGIVLRDSHGVIIDCNEMAAVLLGATREDLIGKVNDDSSWNLVREDGTPFPAHEQPANVTLRTGKAGHNVIMGTNNFTQARHWVSVNTYEVDLEDGTKGVISSVVDVTGKLKQERSLRLLTEVNRVMMFAHDEASCFQQLCNVLVEHGHYALAWIAVMSSGKDGTEEGGVDVSCAAGVSDYLFVDNDGWWGSKASGLGPPARAIRTGETQVINDLSNSGWSEYFRLRAKKYGLGSMTCIPFDLVGRRATLNVYDRDRFDFDDVTQKALEELVREAEFGLNHVRSVQRTEMALEETMSAMETLRATERARAEAEESFRLAFEDNMAPMLTSDLDGLITAVNEAFCKMIGHTKEELLGAGAQSFTYIEDVGITEDHHRLLLSGEVDQVRYVKRYVRKDGRVIFVEVSKSSVRDESGRMLYFVISQRDITEERTLTEQLSHQALHDPLTGLANRALFEDRLAQAHARILRQGGMGAVLLVDLDEFKSVNDTYGHLVGDKLLMAVARRLEQSRARRTPSVASAATSSFTWPRV
jgi:PAS domain S-box-containing protein